MKTLKKHLRRRGVYLQLFALLVELLRRIFRMARIHHFTLSVCYGDENPARTGMLKGFAESISGFVKAKNKCINLRFEPVFSGKKIAAEADVEITITLMAIFRQIVMLTISSLKKKKIRAFVFGLIREQITSFFSSKKNNKIPSIENS
jgi:hypothetical protein